MSVDTSNVILEVEDLHTYFFNRTNTVKAVDGVSFYLRQGETLGIVGESGCGKTMTALSLLRLVPQPAGKIISGEIRLNGDDLLQKSDEEMRQIRGRQISMILQDPQTSLNPVFTIGNQLMEALGMARKEGRKGMVNRAVDALRNVNVAAPERRLEDFPHQMSGGMKQRVVGAIALSCEPGVIIADEPTTALDVTIQLQYLALVEGHSGGDGTGHHIHYPRLRRGGPHVRPGGGNVRGARRGKRPGARDIQRAFPPLHQGTDRLGAQAGGKDRAVVLH